MRRGGEAAVRSRRSKRREGRPLSEESAEQSAQRRAKLAELRARGQAYPNDFRPDPRGPVAPVGQHSTRGVWEGNYIR